MKNNLRKITLTLLASVTLAATSIAQFEGEIKFDKTVGKVHVSYKYFVKGDNVRVEEVSEDGSIDGIQLMDLKEKKVYALSPERKLYMEAPNRRPASSVNVVTKKTGKTKEILGKSCFEIIATSKEQDRKIVYWVTKGDYTFFKPMLTTLNRKERQSMYFLELAGMEGHFPMHSVEYILSSGEKVSELKTTKVDKRTLKPTMFKVPDGYTKFER